MAMATPQAPGNDVLFAGSLSKRTKYTKKWKKYYWRVMNGGMLYYYKDVKHNKVLGQMDIKRSCYDIRYGVDAIGKVAFPSYIPKSCCIKISLTDRDHYLYAETPASASEWVRVLSSVSGVVSRRRSETDAQFRELEKRRVALRNARQRRSKRNRPDTISVDLVLECVEGEIEDIEDPYVTILPPSPSQLVAHFSKKPSTATLLRRSVSVPNALGDGPNQLSVPVLFTASNSSMTSLYDEDTAVPRKPARVAPPPPKVDTNCVAPKKPERRRRRSFSEDHPVLQRNTLLRETRKAYKKRQCASPEITSTTFTFGSLNDVHKTAESSPSPVKNVINTSPSAQSEASVEVVNVVQQSTPSQYSTTSQLPPILRNKENSATPTKRFASKEKAAHRKSLPGYAISPSTPVSDSFEFPVPPPRPPSTFVTPVQHNNTAVSRFTKMGPRRQSLPDFMACPELAPISPTMVRQISKDLSPPVAATERFHKTHRRRQSLPEFMPFAPINNPENQRKLQKALGGTRPQSVVAQQAMIAELQIASQLNQLT